MILPLYTKFSARTCWKRIKIVGEYLEVPGSNRTLKILKPDSAPERREGSASVIDKELQKQILNILADHEGRKKIMYFQDFFEELRSSLNLPFPVPKPFRHRLVKNLKIMRRTGQIEVINRYCSSRSGAWLSSLAPLSWIATGNLLHS